MVVSLLELIARPNDFDGKPVTLIGFAQLEYDGHGLYLHREDAEQRLSTNAVWVDVDLKPHFTAFNGRYVIVQGVFDAKHMGKARTFRGGIREVSRYDPWPTPSERNRHR